MKSMVIPMKVYVDNNHCKDEKALCESLFGGPITLFFNGHPRLEDIRVSGCVTKITEPEYQDKATFHILRASGDTRILYISQTSWPNAFYTWMDLYIPQKARITI